MAKQNFLAGGFYGKLGVVVGQRWKNIRTIRSYVIPANPRTERQQANRGVFGGATRWSQIAMSMNYNATCFEHNSMSRWNYRMKTCRALQDDGAVDLELIPLYPISFTPPFMINAMEVVERQQSKKVVFSVSGTLPQTDRVLSIMFHLYDENERDLGLKLYMGTFKAGNNPTVEVIFDDLAELNDKCKARVVSRDDVDSTTDLVGSPMISIQDEAPDIRDFNTTIQSISKALDGVTIVFAEPYKATESTAFSGSVYAVSGGAFEEVQGANLTLHNEGGYFAVTIPCSYTLSQYILAFAPGSEVRITSISAIGSKFEYTKSNETLTFSDDDLSRTMGEYTLTLDNVYETIIFEWAMKNLGNLSNQNVACVLKSSISPGATNGINTTFVLRAYSDTRLQLISNDNRRTFAMQSGDWLTYANASIVVNGVTYNIAGETRKSITNTRTTTYLTPARCRVSAIGSHSWDGSDYSADCYIHFLDWNFAGSASIQIASSTEALITFASGGRTADIESDTGEEYLTALISFGFDSNLGTPQKWTIQNTSTKAFTYNGINYFFELSDQDWVE